MLGFLKKRAPALPPAEEARGAPLAPQPPEPAPPAAPVVTPTAMLRYLADKSRGRFHKELQQMWVVEHPDGRREHAWRPIRTVVPGEKGGR